MADISKIKLPSDNTVYNVKDASSMHLIGTLGTGGDITAIPTSGVTKGDTYKVITAGTWAGSACNVGDLLVALNSGSIEATTANWCYIPSGNDMVILSYGSSTWAEFLAAYRKNSVVYCRASSGSNPASGAQSRLAFLAYVNISSNNADPTSVEFQYYRTVKTKSDAQQGDQVYIYKLSNTGGWSLETRENYTKIVAGTGLTSTYSNSVLTINNSVTDTTYSLSMSGNRITLTPSSGTASYIDLPIYDGTVV